MTLDGSRTIVVCGATGRQGGAVTRHLLRAGWRVRGLTRDPASAKARALAETGAEVVHADMDQPSTLGPALDGAYGVFSVQNPMINGFEREVRQGKNVADAASSAGVQHVVYGSAGMGRPTGVPSWDSKLHVEEHLRQLDLPVTVLRPMAFMELMTDKGFYPPVAAWSVMPKLAGGTTKIPWLAVDDVGAIAATAFGDREDFVGRTLFLAADVCSIDHCRALWREVRGRAPRGIPMPAGLFQRVAGVAGDDLPKMWRWLREGDVPLDTGPTREVHPDALTVRRWLETTNREEGRDGR